MNSNPPAKKMYSFAEVAAILTHDEMLYMRERAMPQVDALMSAGWLFDPVHENAEPWQWAWRRPKRRKNSKGMRFASTNQAYQALRREKPELPEYYVCRPLTFTP